MEKRLYRSRKNRVLAGVCGGLGEYFNIDPVIIRVISVILILVSGFFPGLLAYIILALIIPSEGPNTSGPGVEAYRNGTDRPDSGTRPDDGAKMTYEPTSNRTGILIAGLVILMLGVIALFGTVSNVWLWQYTWPFIIIAIGIGILFVVLRRSR